MSMSQSPSRAKWQSLEIFAADMNQALHNNLLSFTEAEELSSTLGVIQARLNSYRNAFVPVHKLPAEILARVFEFVIAPRPLRDLGDWPASIPPRQATWNRKLVFVCTRWWKIATQCQRLWYYVVDKDVDDLRNYSPRAVLRRSGSAVPLHLYMTSTPQPTTASVSRWVIKNQPLRVEALYIQLFCETPIKAMLESLATPLPSLRLLVVDGSWECREELGAKMRTILGGGALDLKALVWSFSVPFVPGNAFPNLADLNLNQLEHGVLDLDRLLQLLSNCPRLETLTLVQHSFDVTTRMARDRRLVPLHRLRAMWIHSMPVDAALTTLAYLQLPTGAIVRLSELTQSDSGSVAPSISPIPFLQHMDDLIRLDVITSRSRRQASLHFVAVGACSRFWIHVDSVGGARAYVRSLCGMLPKENLRTLRFSVDEMADLVVIRDAMLGPLPSLSTLLMRHSKLASLPSALSGIVAVSRALCPGGVPEHNFTSPVGEESDNDSEASSDGFSDTDSDSDPYSGTDSDDGQPGFGAAGQSLNNPRNHDADSHADFPIDISGEVPASQLKVVGLEVKCVSTVSLKSFVRMVEARKQSGRPLDTVLCSLKGVDKKDMDDMQEHVGDGVRDIPDKLWVPTIDEGWLMKNDYWRLHPEPRDSDCEDGYAEWGFNMEDW